MLAQAGASCTCQTRDGLPFDLSQPYSLVTNPRAAWADNSTEPGTLSHGMDDEDGKPGLPEANLPRPSTGAFPIG